MGLGAGAVLTGNSRASGRVHVSTVAARRRWGIDVRRTILACCALVSLASGLGAAAETLALPPAGSDLVGEPRAVAARHEDTLIDIARRHGLGYEEIVNANPGVDPWLPGAGVEIGLPKRRLLPMAARGGIGHVAVARQFVPAQSTIAFKSPGLLHPAGTAGLRRDPQHFRS